MRAAATLGAPPVRAFLRVYLPLTLPGLMTGATLVPATQIMLGTWAVTIFVPYVDDTDMLATQYPLLEAVRDAIHATDAPSGERWCYLGQKIALVYPDRLAYEQRYSVRFVTGS